MTSVMKSPNMMSTTGRIPVMAAPSAMPVKPASEIGVSLTRSGPNSSTRPLSTLNGVPASATSSPRMNTASSRLSSSASASRTAWPRVISRVASSVDMHRHLFGIGVGCLEPELHALPNLGRRGLFERLELVGAHALLEQAGGEQRDRVALPQPRFLLGPGAVGAIDVADMVAAVAVGVAEQEAGPGASTRPRNRFGGSGVDCHHILPVHLVGRDVEGGGARQRVAGGRLAAVRVLVVEVVLADVDDRQLPERGHVHDLVEEALPERPLAEEADRNLVGSL